MDKQSKRKFEIGKEYICGIGVSEVEQHKIGIAKENGWFYFPGFYSQNLPYLYPKGSNAYVVKTAKKVK